MSYPLHYQHFSTNANSIGTGFSQGGYPAALSAQPISEEVPSALENMHPLNTQVGHRRLSQFHDSPLDNSQLVSPVSYAVSMRHSRKRSLDDVEHDDQRDPVYQYPTFQDSQQQHHHHHHHRHSIQEGSTAEQDAQYPQDFIPKSHASHDDAVATVLPSPVDLPIYAQHPLGAFPHPHTMQLQTFASQPPSPRISLSSARDSVMSLPPPSLISPQHQQNHQYSSSMPFSPPQHHHHRLPQQHHYHSHQRHRSKVMKTMSGSSSPSYAFDDNGMDPVDPGLHMMHHGAYHVPDDEAIADEFHPFRTESISSCATANGGGPPSMVGQPGMPSPAPRPKGPKLKFSPRDDALLVELKEGKKLSWKQIADFFPGRTSGTLQVRYCTRLKAKRTVWGDEMVQKLRLALSDYENDRWRVVAAKLGSGFSAAACKEKATELATEEGDGVGGILGLANRVAALHNGSDADELDHFVADENDDEDIDEDANEDDRQDGDGVDEVSDDADSKKFVPPQNETGYPAPEPQAFQHSPASMSTLGNSRYSPHHGDITASELLHLHQQNPRTGPLSFPPSALPSPAVSTFANHHATPTNTHSDSSGGPTSTWAPLSSVPLSLSLATAPSNMHQTPLPSPSIMPPAASRFFGVPSTSAASPAGSM